MKRKTEGPEALMHEKKDLQHRTAELECFESKQKSSDDARDRALQNKPRLRTASRIKRKIK
jgi:hypothetical protein